MLAVMKMLLVLPLMDASDPCEGPFNGKPPPECRGNAEPSPAPACDPCKAECPVHQLNCNSRRWGLGSPDVLGCSVRATAPVSPADAVNPYGNELCCGFADKYPGIDLENRCFVVGTKESQWRDPNWRWVDCASGWINKRQYIAHMTEKCPDKLTTADGQSHDELNMCKQKYHVRGLPRNYDGKLDGRRCELKSAPGSGLPSCVDNPAPGSGQTKCCPPYRWISKALFDSIAYGC